MDSTWVKIPPQIFLSLVSFLCGFSKYLAYFYSAKQKKTKTKKTFGFFEYVARFGYQGKGNQMYILYIDVI